ncbi:FapA family protein [Aliiglaciecola sp. CAU 1673]|uniref:DUF342 domain-containing protein n=1 Tax=Aliiglaciecola sp. CAU 1673 TaxID=3032595 RepID=UPI0023DB5597|nr:FapA family protein [Aliiglaciecola sp. CAU 1673]MDF2177583.1 FapA family protein [Aliiglaciecola sp. CAU 1673]
MKGVTLSLEENGKFLMLGIDTQLLQEKLDGQALLSFIKSSQYGSYFLFDDNIKKLAKDSQKAKDSNLVKQFKEKVGERRDAEVKFKIQDADMVAELTVITAFGGSNPNFAQLIKQAQQMGIKRGLGRRQLMAIVKEAKFAAPGTEIKRIVAKGLPARNGRNSKLHPLVPNALERILRPQELSVSRVDMRNLGDVICVKAGAPVLRRLAPGKGRSGYTLRGEKIPATAGEWVKFSPGEGTKLSPHDENLLLAEIAGMPKFRDDVMTVDQTYICKGVNVGTGNVNYEGAVIVNGDVTEKMIIEAKGDVTINGFVESATIKSGGDIIITQGAMGKQNEVGKQEYSTKLIAQGSVHIQHGQGLDIACAGNVTVGKQLAHSRIVCRGGVIVGPIDNPNGNLFGCEIQCRDSVRAGTIGAVSGSSLYVDFSDGYNYLVERKDILDDLLKVITNNFLRHKGKIDIIQKKKMPPDIAQKVSKALKLYKSEEQILGWLHGKIEHLSKAREQYLDMSRLVASKKIHAGVVVKLNTRTWKTDREYNRGHIHYFEHQWHFEGN